ncbi:hypothetical protein [Mycobacterium simiae]|nr:hypothetical protein [Mycobacterium simiae]
MTSSTGSSVKRRIVRAVDITSPTSLLAPVMVTPFGPGIPEATIH